MNQRRFLNQAVAGGVVLVLAACGGSARDTSEGAGATMEQAEPSQQTGEWVVLFDGSDLSQWRGYRRQDVPAGWRVEDGTLAFVPGAGDGDLITREQFGDFELQLEWRISEAGNSGIMYRVSEDQEHPYQTGPEMQVLDDERHPDGVHPKHRAGALYGMIAPPPNVTRPVGEWNQARIRLEGNRIQHWLNQQQIVDIEIGSEEWNRLLAESKFIDWPGFAAHRTGHIALQDHDDRVWYRNIRIRPL